MLDGTLREEAGGGREGRGGKRGERVKGTREGSEVGEKGVPRAVGFRV
jgi:hypothetical protein